MNGKLFKVSMNIKNGHTFWAEPFISVKKPIVTRWHTPYEKKLRMRAMLACNVRAHAKHSYETGQECVIESVRYMRAH